MDGAHGGRGGGGGPGGGRPGRHRCVGPGAGGGGDDQPGVQPRPAQLRRPPQALYRIGDPLRRGLRRRLDAGLRRQQHQLHPRRQRAHLPRERQLPGPARLLRLHLVSTHRRGDRAAERRGPGQALRGAVRRLIRPPVGDAWATWSAPPIAFSSARRSDSTPPPRWRPTWPPSASPTSTPRPTCRPCRAAPTDTTWPTRPGSATTWAARPPTAACWTPSPPPASATWWTWCPTTWPPTRPTPGGGTCWRTGKPAPTPPTSTSTGIPPTPSCGTRSCWRCWATTTGGSSTGASWRWRRTATGCGSTTTTRSSPYPPTPWPP